MSAELDAGNVHWLERKMRELIGDRIAAATSAFEYCDGAFLNASERDAARSSHERTKIALQSTEEDRLSVIVERDEAQAEAAAMRDALGTARIEISRMATTGTGFSCSVIDDIEDALSGSAGRALAERVALWRELQTALHTCREHGDKCGGYGVWLHDHARARKAMHALAALDETTSTITCPKCGLVMKPWPKWIGMSDAGNQCSDCGSAIDEKGTA